MEIFDVAAAGTRGPVWGLKSDDLNATLLAWPPGDGTPEHANDERDVLVLVVEGSGAIVVDGERAELRAGVLVVVPKGSSRRIDAGPDGIRYVTVHRRRGGLAIAPAARARSSSRS
jgi:quercetin dioxygenase-like cupin family protein